MKSWEIFGERIACQACKSTESENSGIVSICVRCKTESCILCSDDHRENMSNHEQENCPLRKIAHVSLCQGLNIEGMNKISSCPYRSGHMCYLCIDNH